MLIGTTIEKGFVKIMEYIELVFDFIEFNWTWLVIGIAGATFLFLSDLHSDHQ